MMLLLLSRSVASSNMFRSCRKHVYNSFLRKYYSSSSCAVEELPLPYSSPLLMLPPEYITHNNEETLGSQKNVNFHFFSPTENKFMKLSNRKLPLQISTSLYMMSSNGWLACANPFDCRLYLLNLFSSSPQIIPLPPVETLFHVRRYESNPASKAFKRFLVYSDVHCNRLEMVTPHYLASTILNRIALSSDPKKDENCTVMICHNGLIGALSFCRIGDFAWTSLKKRVEPYGDIVYSKKDRLFYTTNNYEKVEGWDLNNPSSPRRIITDINMDTGFMESFLEIRANQACFHFSTYLVESPEGDILCVHRNYSRIEEDGSFTGEDNTDPLVPGPYRTTWFDAYKLDFGKKRMDRVTCLGDAVLFVSRSEAFSVYASDHPGLKPNSIYFDDDAFHEVTLPSGTGCAGHDNGVFDFEEKTVTPLYQPFEMKKIMPAPLWIFPKP